MPQASLLDWLQKPKAVISDTQPTNPVSNQPFLAKRDAVSAYTPALTTRPASIPTRQDGTPASLHVHSPPSEPPSTPPEPLFSSLRPLAPNIELVPLTPALLPAFRRLNSLMLPIPYPDSFYNESLSDEAISGITLLALWHATPPTSILQSVDSPAYSPISVNAVDQPHLVAAIRCKLLSPPPTSSPLLHDAISTPPTLYISTLCVLPPYRRYGIATHLLAHTTSAGIQAHNIDAVTAHVWEANDDALKWYTKRGFKEIGREKGYYRKLRPTGAALVRRSVGVMDRLGMEGMTG
ncbi:acyl-CoA N-acyltransferase [Lepidopterella palustris CBS 459.81]|uniref:Acyl-CoA N-acyltransferase n=1 Tax=Lepidopterella palustris CBS 459.81 TaxID=1314670 RepID=A0A8E2JDJ9_9PEZI|nr:acyl-CoA N-acyltransferase [Lepidopterella palustris CBS 459.81]